MHANSNVGGRMNAKWLILGLMLVGCTKTVRRDVAVFDVSPGKISQPAPMSAKYVVKVDADGSDAFRKLPETQIRVDRGTVMGFESTPQGVVAFAGNERIWLDIPDGATVKWQRKSKKPTQFAKNMRGVGEAALVTVGAVGVVMVESAFEDDDDCLPAVSPDLSSEVDPKAFDALVRKVAEQPTGRD